MIRRCLLLLVCLLLSAAGILAAGGHWTVNPHSYQYDMTAYLNVGSGVQGDYEVAAFCGEECRGVGTLLTAADGTQVFQLRIRSNETNGERISFRVWKISARKEYYAPETIDFEALAVAGTPSEPLVLTINAALKGDLNGDNAVTPQDASLVLQLVARKLSADAPGIQIDVADVNGDGSVTPQDASLILQYVAKKITW